jgi:hypothetical protein
LKPFVNSIVEEWFVNDESIRYDDLTVDVNVSSGEKKICEMSMTKNPPKKYDLSLFIFRV